ncbi:MAG: hypothetical protein AB1609_04235 [Bacillota bacterium]
MIPYTVLPAEWFEPGHAADGEGDGPQSPAAGEGVAGARVELPLGHWHGVPVWVEGYVERPGRLVVERLITTDPDLYLWPALAPGRTLPLA